VLVERELLVEVLVVLRLLGAERAGEDEQLLMTAGAVLLLVRVGRAARLTENLAADELDLLVSSALPSLSEANSHHNRTAAPQYS
jgi:hypothetical protein